MEVKNCAFFTAFMLSERLGMVRGGGGAMDVVGKCNMRLREGSNLRALANDHDAVDQPRDLMAWNRDTARKQNNNAIRI